MGKLHMLFGKSKIGNYSLSVVHEDIRKFQVSMEESFLTHLDKAFNDILEDFEGFSLWNSSLFLDQVAQIALVAELGNNVAVGGLAHDVKAPQDISVVESG
jgi:hypothetical protein